VKDDFDFIVIGAGSAGCVLARRLSEDGAARVALIEAGGPPDPVLSRIPGAAMRQQDTKSDWGFRTVPQKHLYDRVISYPRGRVLGGTSVLNYMVYVRGNAGDYNVWAQLGNLGWSYDDVLPYFIRAEANAEFEDVYHGTNGPLSVERHKHAHPVCEVFFEAAAQCGIPFNPDVNGATQHGCGYLQATTRNGVRCDAATGYLDPVQDRPNLTVVPEALVTRIVVEKGCAVAVELLEKGRTPRRLTAEAEIVLSAGSIGSPHLLMLSGIGPADHLHAHGVDVILDNPHVGQHLEDHYSQNATSRRLKDPAAIYGNVTETFDAAISEFHETGGGPLATMHLDSVAFHSVDPGADYPQFQSIFTPSLAEFYRNAGRVDLGSVKLGGYVCRPHSRGSVTLASDSPLVPPRIDPNYLSDPEDLRLMIAHSRRKAEILNASAFDAICEGPAAQSDATDAELEHLIRETASTIWHPTSTCRMGPGEGAVVGPDLALHGLTGLSVCDASVMPTMVSGNTNAPTIMVAEKGSDLIRSRQS
jgi:choline dehydrogenase-like flavoprotein